MKNSSNAMQAPDHTGDALPSESRPAVEHRRRRRAGYDPQEEILSTRELEVLQLVCEELTNAEIGDRLCLSPRTVETYRRTMMEKIGCRNTVGLVLYAVRRGMAGFRRI